MKHIGVVAVRRGRLWLSQPLAASSLGAASGTKSFGVTSPFVAFMMASRVGHSGRRSPLIARLIVAGLNSASSAKATAVISLVFSQSESFMITILPQRQFSINAKIAGATMVKLAVVAEY